MSAIERRKQIIELLCQRRHDTAENLSFEFNVSKKTIYRDVLELSLSYPIYIEQGYQGGIYIAEGYYLDKQFLTNEQENLLRELTGTVNESQAKILQQILSTFGNPIKQR